MGHFMILNGIRALLRNYVSDFKTKEWMKQSKENKDTGKEKVMEKKAKLIKSMRKSKSKEKEKLEDSGN